MKKIKIRSTALTGAFAIASCALVLGGCSGKAETTVVETTVAATASSEITSSETVATEAIATTTPSPTPTPTPAEPQTLFFGSYNGEPLEWTVLDSRDNQLLIITTDAIGTREYHHERTEITWEDCDLRTWLNGDFYDETFAPDEQDRILTTDVSADDNPHYDTEAGNPTQDKIFLLSVVEAEAYFDSDNARICELGGEACWWWLRSPGYGQHRASMVCIDGTIGYSYGFFVDSTFEAVRPVMWITE